MNMLNKMPTQPLFPKSQKEIARDKITKLPISNQPRNLGLLPALTVLIPFKTTVGKL